MQWQFLREVRAGQEKIKTRKKTVTDGCDCLFNYKLIIKNVFPELANAVDSFRQTGNFSCTVIFVINTFRGCFADCRDSLF